MKTTKFLMFTAASLLIPAATASAEIKRPTTVMVIPHPVNDKAPVSGTPARLRRTDSEQAGNEMPTFAMFKDGKSGIYFAMSTELNGEAAFRRVQLSAVPFQLTQAADGSVTAAADLTKAKFVTRNNGNEYRQAHVPVAFAIDGGEAVCAQYNWQPQGSGDTKLYIQCFNAAGEVVMPQTEAFAKNNDDVCGSIEGNVPALVDSANGKERYIRWCLANGNGNDNAWAFVSSITKQANGTYTYKRDYDLTILQQEERSRGMCKVIPGQNLAVCAGTEGNTQPQRQGVHLAGVDLTPGKYNGQNQQGALLWKQQISGRTENGGRRTYSMRAMISQIETADANGNLVPSDMIIWRHGELEGNNNNNGKGGTYYANKFAVMKVTREGFQYVTPLTDLGTTELLGLDATHNMNTFALVGQGTDLKPALLVENGSHTGGNSSSQIRALLWDQAANKFTNGGTFAGPPADRHLYSNYLGNNPGNQGKNHAFAQLLKNPFAGQNGNNDQFLVMYASTGKGDNMDPAVKMAAYLSVMPVASGAPAATGGGSDDSGNDPGTDPGTGTGGTDNSDDGSTDAGADTSLGGCSAGGSAGFASFLLIGLATLIRRRRR